MLNISIITAVRNAVGQIGATLRSVESQTYAGIEHVVVDGASSDGTQEYVEKAGRRVSRLVSEPDKGVYDAFNKGLRLATGDVIAFLNAGDTYVEPGVIAKIAARLEETGADLLFADLFIVDENDRSKVVRHYRSSAFSPKLIRFGIMPAHPTMFIRRHVYEQLGGYDPTYRIAGDFELVVRLFTKLKVSFLYQPETLVCMLRGGLSTSGIKSKLTITKEMLRACRSNGVRTNLAMISVLRLPLRLTELRFGLARLHDAEAVMDSP